MSEPVIDISNINVWKHNDMSFPTFNNTYDSTTNTNTLLYMGGNGYERLYLGVECTANQQVSFSVKFCSPTGYSCSYGDSQEYIAITSNKPNNVQELWSQTVVASTPLDGTASNTPVLYTVSYTPTEDTTLYFVIDYGYMVDGTQVTLVYQDITLTGGTVDITGIWYDDDGRLVNSDLPAPMSGTYMQDPYPPFWWYVENERLQNRFLAEPSAQGAFYDCTQLKKVEIPETVKYIGEYAFANTALTTVKIARDCTFFPTSFPPRCIIQYYDA